MTTTTTPRSACKTFEMEFGIAVHSYWIEIPGDGYIYVTDRDDCEYDFLIDDALLHQLRVIESDTNFGDARRVLRVLSLVHMQ